MPRSVRHWLLEVPRGAWLATGTQYEFVSAPPGEMLRLPLIVALVPSNEATPANDCAPVVPAGGVAVYLRVRAVLSKNGPHLTLPLALSQAPQLSIPETAHPPAARPRPRRRTCSPPA